MKANVLSLIALALALHSTSCGRQRIAEDDVDGRPDVLELNGEAETAFFDAACECHAALLGTAPLGGGVSEARDPHLYEYVTQSAGRCRGAGAVRSGTSLPNVISDSNVNHCQDARSTTNMPTSDSLKDGFCRANFNYCIGSELQLKSQSIGRAPGSHGARSEIQRLARDRFQRSAVEYASTVGFYTHACSENVTSASVLVHSQLCDRLESQPSIFADVVHARLADAVIQTSDLLRSEVNDLVAESDRLTPMSAGSPAAFASAMWGEDGARTRAAERIMGDLDEDIEFLPSGALSELGPERGPSYDFLDVRASYANVDGSVRKALELMSRHAIPVGVEVNATSGRRRMAAESSSVVFSRAAYNLLDHRIAADAYLAACSGSEPPGTLCATHDYSSTSGTGATSGQGLRARSSLTRSEFLAFGTDPIPTANSPLRNIHSLTPEHVTRALSHARNLLLTMNVETASRAQVPGVEVGWSLTAERIMRIAPRSFLSFAEALSRDDGGAGALNTTPPQRADGEEPMRTPFADGTIQQVFASNTVPRNWYDLEVARLDRLGASGALHHLRVHVRRLMNLPEGVSPIVDVEKLRPVLTTLDEHVGRWWTEWDGYGEISDRADWPMYLACVGSDCDTPSSPTISPSVFENEDGEWRTWSVYYEPSVDGVFAGGAPVFVRTEREASCYIHGRALGTCAPSSVVEVAYESETGGAVASERLGVTRRTFWLPDSAWSAGTSEPHYGQQSDVLFVLWRTGTGGQAVYELVDIVRPNDAVAVHAFGGAFGELFGRVVARDPQNPALAAFNSFGLPNDFVPPVENELIGNGNATEDSYRTYLSWADASAQEAGRMLDAVRAMETTVFQNGRSDAALLEDAALQAEQVASTACGASAEDTGCAVERTNKTLWELGVLPAWAPATHPWTPGAVADLGLPRDPNDPMNPHATALSFPFPTADSEVKDCETIVKLVLDSGGSDFDLTSVGDENGELWGDYADHYFTAALECTRWFVLSRLSGVVIRDVPVDVANALRLEAASPGVPPQTYDAFDGDLRMQMFQMHTSLAELRASMMQFDATYSSATRQKDLAVLELEDLGDDGVKRRCRWKKAFKFVAVIAAAVVAVVAAVYTGGTSIAAFVVLVASVATAQAAAVGMAVVDAQQAIKNDECSNEDDAARLGGDALSNMLASMRSMMSYLDAAHQGVRRFALADAEMDSLARRVRLALARREIEDDVIASDSLADMPEWRALQGVTASRARDAVFRAQRYAFIARRAIEYRLSASLGSMTREEAFVAPPATWANDLFVAHSHTTGGAGGAELYLVDADHELEEYVENLRDFVDGYSFLRPFADGADTQVVNLSQINWAAAPTQRFHQRLVYKCRDLGQASEWRVVVDNPTDPISVPCASHGGVEYAEIVFEIPARLDGYFGDRLASGSFNYRHNRFAVNFEASSSGSVRVCSLLPAAQRAECDRDRTLPYTMMQSGEVALESYEGDFLWFGGTVGVVRSGRGLSTGVSLSNPLVGENAGYVNMLWRNELRGRPLAGTHALRIHGRPEIVWSNLENVQVALDYRYWTRQR